MKHVIVILVLALFTSHLSTSHAETPGQFARMVLLKPKPGQAAQFTEGYKRHLAWHKDHGDPWTWHGWTFVLGNRVGYFMDGTFGHALEDFDHAVDPRGDSADNSAKVTPYADFLSHGVYERIEAASHGSALPDSAPYLAITTYFVVTGQEDAFENAIADLARVSPGRLSWYRLRAGGELPQYVLMRAAQTFSAGALAPAWSPPPGLVQRVESELLRYQSEMSYDPKK